MGPSVHLPAATELDPVAVAVAVGLALALGAAVAGLARRGDRWVLVSWCALGGAAGASCAAPPPSPHVYAHVGRVRYHLVTAQPVDGRTCRLFVWATWHEGEWTVWDPPARARTRPRLPATRLVLSGTLDVPEPWAGGPPKDGWMRVRRAYHATSAGTRVVCGQAGERQDWVRACVEALGPTHGAMAAAALLGERRLLPEPLVGWFERTGTIHLLAISGFHVSLLGAIVWTAARILTGGARWSRWAALGAMIGYAVFVGAPISVVRALSMAGLALAGPDSGRGARIWNGWGWVTALMTISDPRQPLQTGFALSISATAGVLLGARLATLLGSRLRRFEGGRLAPTARLAAALAPLAGTSLGATLLTTPWMLYAFANMYPLSLLANLVAIPAMALLLPAMVVAIVAEKAGLPGANAWSASAIHLGDAFVALLETLAHPAGRWVLSGRLDRENAWAATLAAALLLVVVNRTLEAQFARPAPRQATAPRGPRRLNHHAAAGFTVAVLAAIGHAPLLARLIPPDGAVVRFLSVGQGDAILIEGPKQRWLVDFGPGDWGGRDKLVPHLRRLGIHRIDRAWITHGDMDHWGGLIPVLSHGIRVDTLALSGAADFSASFWRTVTEADPRPQVLRVHAPERHRISPEVTMDVLHPWRGVDAEDRNDAIADPRADARSEAGRQPRADRRPRASRAATNGRAGDSAAYLGIAGRPSRQPHLRPPRCLRRAGALPAHCLTGTQQSFRISARGVGGRTPAAGHPTSAHRP